MHIEHSKDIVKKKKISWVEAARVVLDQFSGGPLSNKVILSHIQEQQIFDTGVPSPLGSLNLHLHNNCKGADSVFYKLREHQGVYGLRSELPDDCELWVVEEDDSLAQVNEDGLPLTPCTTAREKRKKELVLYAEFACGWQAADAAGRTSSSSPTPLCQALQHHLPQRLSTPCSLHPASTNPFLNHVCGHTSDL